MGLEKGGIAVQTLHRHYPDTHVHQAIEPADLVHLDLRVDKQTRASWLADARNPAYGLVP
jgi:hypothetical protein